MLWTLRAVVLALSGDGLLKALGPSLRLSRLVGPLALLGRVEGLEDGLGPLPAIRSWCHDAAPYAVEVNTSLSRARATGEAPLSLSERAPRSDAPVLPRSGSATV